MVGAGLSPAASPGGFGQRRAQVYIKIHASPGASSTVASTVGLDPEGRAVGDQCHVAVAVGTEQSRGSHQALQPLHHLRTGVAEGVVGSRRNDRHFRGHPAQERTGR